MIKDEINHVNITVTIGPRQLLEIKYENAYGFVLFQNGLNQSRYCRYINMHDNYPFVQVLIIMSII